jgi:hypothetical protein
MKKILLVLFFISGITFSQDYYKKIGKESCDCINKENIDLEKATKEEIETKFGLCILASYTKFSDLIPEKDKLDLDDDKSLEKLGIKIAMEMMTDCPKIVLAMAKLEDGAESGAEEIEEDPTIQGTFLNTKIDGFLYVNVKESTGKMNQLALINNFDNSYLIIDKVLKPNQKVEVSYFDGELYDVKTNKFINVKVISNITKL